MCMCRGLEGEERRMVEVTVIMNILRSVAAPVEAEGISSGIFNEGKCHGVFALITRWKRAAKLPM